MIQRLSLTFAMMKSLWALVALSLLAGCINGRDLDRPPVPLGDFKLGHNIVVAPNLTMGPLSREATPEEWIAAVEGAIDDRFRRYEGDRIYHFGVSVEGYVLAQVGVPFVLQPNSVLIVRLTVWDDGVAAKMNAEPKEITILEAISAETVAGSGLTQTREEQIENLAILAAKQIEEYLVKQMRQERWFRGFRPQGAQPETAETAAAAEAVDPADLDPAALEEVVEATNSVPAPADTRLVQEPLAAVTDPVVTAFPPVTAPGGTAPQIRAVPGPAAPAN